MCTFVSVAIMILARVKKYSIFFAIGKINELIIIIIVELSFSFEFIKDKMYSVIIIKGRN